MYMLAPSGHPLAAAAAQLVCAACLAPCLPPEASPPADTDLQEEAEAGAKAPQGSGGGGSNGVSRGRGGGDGAPAPPSPPIFDLAAQAASAVSTPASTVGSPGPVELCYSQPAPPPASSHQPPSQRCAAQPPPAPAATSAAGAAAPAAAAAMHDAAAAGGAAPELLAKYHGAAHDTHTARLGRSTHSGELDADSPLPERQPLEIALQVHDGQNSSISVAPCTCSRQYQSTASVPADNASAVADANSPSCHRDQLRCTRQCSVHKANPKRAKGKTVYMAHQVVSLRVLEDVTCASVRALAFSVYGKVARRSRPPLPPLLLGGGSQALPAASRSELRQVCQSASACAACSKNELSSA